MHHGNDLDRPRLRPSFTGDSAQRRPSDAAAEALRTVTVHDFDALSAHTPAWDRLALEAPQRVASLFPAWVEASFRHGLRPDERWFCCFAYAGQRLVGVLPVVVSPHSWLGPTRPVLRTSIDRHSPFGDIPLAPAYAGSAFRALLAEACRQAPNHLSLHFRMVRQNSPVLKALASPVDGYTPLHGTRYPVSFLKAEGSFDDYLGCLGNMRRNLKRSYRKLAARGDITIEIRKGPAATDAFLPDFMALEASGWKGRSGTAILNHPDLIRFFSAVAKNFATQGRLEWHLIRVSDRLVAALLAFRCGPALILAKYAFNEDFAECSLGSLLLKETFREGFLSPHIIEINTTSTADGFHSWRALQDEYHDLHLVRTGLTPSLFYLPQVTSRVCYQRYVSPLIPAAARSLWRRLKRRGDPKHPQSN